MRSTIVIADDHGLIASGLAAEMTRQGREVAGIADNGLDAISLIKLHQPDCAILDLNMPGATGAEVFLEGRRWSPKTQFIILTGNPSGALFTKLIEAGVAGIFVKSDKPEAVSAGVSAVLRGQTVLSPSVSKVVAQQKDQPELTNREYQVLQCIARGLSNAATAEALGVSAKTVDTHRTNLMQKLGVHSSATLLMKSVKLGLISAES